MGNLPAYRDLRSRLAIWLQSAVAILLLAAIASYVDVSTVLSTASNANLFWVGAAAVLLPANLSLETLKWQMLLSESGIETTRKEAAGSVLAGYTLGLLTPARIGDYAGRVLSLSESRKGVLLVMAALDKLYSYWISTLVGTVVLGFLLRGSLPGPSQVWLLTFGLGCALVVLVGALIFNPGFAHGMVHSLLRGRWARLWQRHLATSCVIAPSTRFTVLLLSSLKYAVFSTQFIFLVLAFAPGSTVSALYAGVVLVFFAKTVIPSISVFDLGIRESAAIFFLGIFGITASAALNASLLLFAVNLALPALGGILFIPGPKWGSLGSAAKEARTIEVRTG